MSSCDIALERPGLSRPTPDQTLAWDRIRPVTPRLLPNPSTDAQTAFLVFDWGPQPLLAAAMQRVCVDNSVQLAQNMSSRGRESDERGQRRSTSGLPIECAMCRRSGESGLASQIRVKSKLSGGDVGQVPIIAWTVGSKTHAISSHEA